MKFIMNNDFDYEMTQCPNCGFIFAVNIRDSYKIPEDFGNFYTCPWLHLVQRCEHCGYQHYVRIDRYNFLGLVGAKDVVKR